MMTRRTISSGSPFEQKIGYSRAVVHETPIGLWCFVSGTTGYDYTTMTMPEDPAEQTRNTFRTIEAALAEAGCGFEHVYRARYYLADVSIYDAITPELGAVFGEIRPAATMVVSALTMPEMQIEIEVDAFKPR